MNYVIATGTIEEHCPLLERSLDFCSRVKPYWRQSRLRLAESVSGGNRKFLLGASSTAHADRADDLAISNDRHATLQRSEIV